MQLKFNLNNNNCLEALSGVDLSTPICLEMFVSNAVTNNNENIGIPYIWGLQIKDTLIHGRSIQQLFSCLEYLMRVGVKYIYTFSPKELFFFVKSSYTLSSDTLRAHNGELHKFGFCFEGRTLIVRSMKSISGSNTIEEFCGLSPLLERRIMTPQTHLSTSTFNRLKKYCEYEEKYLEQLIKKYKRIENIPHTLSKTIQQDLSLSCFKNGRTNYLKRLGLYDDRDGIHTLPIMGLDHFRLLEKAFQGGYVGYNEAHVNETIYNVDCYDFVSSYITWMLIGKYPMSFAYRYANPSLTTVNKYLNNEDYCFICEVKFHGLKSKSPCKCIKASELIDENDDSLGVRGIIYERNTKFTNDGGVISSDCLDIITTSIDYSYYNRFYDWDSVEFLYMEVYETGYLPNEYTSVVLDLFRSKSENKNNPNEFVAQVAKKKVNISYGLMVSGFWHNSFEMKNNEFVQVNKELKDIINDYNHFRGRFYNRCSAYQWGIFCTAYARRALFSVIMHLGDDWLYSDTDSVYFIHRPEHIDMLNRYNNMVKNMMYNSPIISSDDDFIIKSKFCNKVYQLGSMDLDASYAKFKYLKPKTYLGIKDDGHYKLVLSGCSNFNEEFFNKVDAFDWFSLDKQSEVPLEYCDCFNDYKSFEAGTYYVNDFRGSFQEVTLPGGCYRIFTDFKITSQEVENVKYALGL